MTSSGLPASKATAARVRIISPILLIFPKAWLKQGANATFLEGIARPIFFAALQFEQTNQVCV
jgi:hypothetical protein